jgi:alpha-L-fucosidase 2
MRVYEEMLDDKDGELSLPVSVSPEYGGASMNAWGKNASFQLSLIHFLCRALCEAAEILGADDDTAKWRDIDTRLPEMSLIDGRIALWEGQDLEHSHRHHSHLAGIYPFDTIDYRQKKQMVDRSIAHWIRKGIGEWSGWCIPWASIIHSRMNNAEAAEMLLEIWRKFFTNEGHGTLHNVNYPGISVMGMGGSKDKEIMQIEAGMAAVTAVQEMLLQNVKGVIRIFAGVPKSWKSVSFRGMRAEGAFLIDAIRKAGETRRVKVLSEKGSHLKIENNIAETVLVKRRGREEAVSGEIIELDTREGERITLIPRTTE